MQNYKTTILGVLLILAAMINAGIEFLKTGKVPDLQALGMAITAGTGLIAAADSKSVGGGTVGDTSGRVTGMQVPFTSSAQPSTSSNPGINLLILLALIPALACSGCAGYQAFIARENATVKAWWAHPSTQQGVRIAEGMALNALVSFGVNVAEQELSGGSVNWSSAGFSAGSVAVRQLELTPGAGDAAAISRAVLTVVKDPSQARAIATVAAESVAAAKVQGADASGALEGAARSLDSAAAVTAGN